MHDNPAAALAIDPNEPPSLSKTPENPSLVRLLSLINAVDEAFVDLSIEEQLDLFEDGKTKIDNCKHVIDRLEAQALIFGKREEEYKSARMSCESQVKALKKYIVFALQKHGFSQFAGHEYMVKIQKGRPSVVTPGDPTIDHKLKFPEFVRTLYEWDKKAIAKALKSGNDAAASISSLKETVSPRFYLRKDI